MQQQYIGGVEYQQQENAEDQELPQYAEVQGETVKLSGLDYSLIKQQTAKDRKKNMLENIRNKIDEFSHKIPVAQPLPYQKKTSDNDQMTRKIQMVGKGKPLINSSTFYLFPLQTNFSNHLPQNFSRRLGRMHSLPLFIHNNQKQIETFKQLIKADQAAKQMRKNRHLEVRKLVPEFASDSEDEQQDQQLSIFGQEDDSSNKVAIQVGRTLNLGVNQVDIFGKKRYIEAVAEEKETKRQTQKDKYEFLRKKIKPNEQAYEQCFPESDL